MNDPNIISESLNLIADFPQSGVVFRDITPILASPQISDAASTSLAENIRSFGGTKVIGIESRGFIFASVAANKTGLPLLLARKPGKLPKETFVKNYQLEYGTSSIELHMDSGISKTDKVVIVDDLVATGGTALAVATLVSENFGIPHENILVLAVIDIGECDGGTQISSKGYNYHTLFQSIL